MKSDINEFCNVELLIKKDGRVIDTRLGHNVWTNTGREYSCMLKAYKPDGLPFRSDRIAYIGLGIGHQIESVDVNRVVSPVAYNTANGQWLKKIDNVKTQFVQGTNRTSIRFSATFGLDELSFSGSLVEIRECGLFTDGKNTEPYTPGDRDTSVLVAGAQNPIAYHSFDPIPKTGSLELEIIWELRH